MLEPLTPEVELEGRLGRLGKIQAWDPWHARKSADHTKWFVSKIARLSHGLGEAEDFRAHFDRVVNQLHHVSVLEFVPVYDLLAIGTSLPGSSLRGREWMIDDPHTWVSEFRTVKARPATAFFVEAPIFVARQWMRHRAFAYLEMSRRYVKDSRVPWTFYGQSPYHDVCVREYHRRLEANMPAELARGCMPVEAMTQFWVAGFDSDWSKFLALRADPHAQPEIQVFAQWIKWFLRK